MLGKLGGGWGGGGGGGCLKGKGQEEKLNARKKRMRVNGVEKQTFDVE